ncbi:glucose-1-phosphate cytidylyltransferase [Sediminicoccus sp. KRV36]|uniref:glucose-1-phosphate cytidylyltransferase n=1 Tax=Sediminicoccus sp. KRV36 TaxID=3133721 RepID=UPI00200BAC0B|nr:glucose-1-phosphate cytidylyltransferase [Sediminicoccus rosea]UPY37433.1 glucose-1-phosphate cytidylyltransferase [Sediminicoccus rosea]UPY38167.1 glucose-1-phosphate cytidylyltransferase [Sediminicoccus rosea]
MKVVILAGGLGTRISEESHLRPKPMIEIGGYPILWHIMKIYASQGATDFIICAGYRGYMIKEYFANYVLHRSDVTIDLAAHTVEYHRNSAEPWRVTIVDTGAETLTGGRLKRIGHLLTPGETFCMTYGDGVADISLEKLLARHRELGAAATLTAVKPPGRYGSTRIEQGMVREFQEKPAGDGGYINGGFFALEPSVLETIPGDLTAWESEPLQGLAAAGRLGAYQHDGFWHAMDTLRDKNHLEGLWQAGRAPWNTWS